MDDPTDPHTYHLTDPTTDVSPQPGVVTLAETAAGRAGDTSVPTPAPESSSMGASGSAHIEVKVYVTGLWILPEHFYTMSVSALAQAIRATEELVLMLRREHRSRFR